MALALGVGLGLFYGWNVNRVEFVDTLPASLRDDYRTDYVLMVAERFHTEPDVEFARGQLSVLGGQAPDVACKDAVRFAHASSYSRQDLELLQLLCRAMQAFSSAETPAGPPR